MNQLPDHTEIKRLHRIHAELQVNAPLDSIKQPEPCQFCAEDADTSTNNARWELVLALLFAALAAPLVWKLADFVLTMVWSMK